MWESLLQSSALVLSVVNGLMLLRSHMRDRPKLDIRPIHPETYQWWFRLPDGTTAEGVTRRFGFLAYMSILNRGLRPVSLESWSLHIRSAQGDEATLLPLNMPEPQINLGSSKKVFPVLGQKGPVYEGSLRVEPGGETSGMALFIYECFGSPSFDPAMVGESITAHFHVRHIFGGKASCPVVFRPRTLESVRPLLPDLEEMVKQIDAQSEERNLARR